MTVHGLVNYLPEIALILVIMLVALFLVYAGFCMGRKTIFPYSQTTKDDRPEIPEYKKHIPWVEDPWAEAMEPPKNPDDRKNRIKTMDGEEEY